MSQHLHEELEVGAHLDQTVRTALTGAAQLVELVARSGAERDRDAAQALREQLLQQRLDDAAAPPHPVGQPAPAPPSREDLSPAARGYLDAAGGQGAAATARAWNAALHDLAADPANPGAATAAAELNAHSRRRHGLDLAATVAGVVSDAQAGQAAVSAETAAAAAAAREQALIVLPAHRDNPDRGVSPTKAATPEETAHRRQTWALARAEWESTRTDLADPRARAEAWAATPMPAKTEVYWRHYDTDAARTVPASPSYRPQPGPAAQPVSSPVGGVPAGVPSERGVAPSKAPNADERAHREQAWRMAQAAHAAALPEGTDPRAARRSWEELEWPDKALRYWTAYDDPASRPLPPPGTTAAVAAHPAVAVEGLGVTRDRVVELNEQAADWFAAQAGPGSKGRDYLEDRLGGDVVDHGPWRLGYAPPGWTNLTDHLRATGATEQELLAAGLGRVSSRGNLIDAFRDRATVAIRDQNGTTLGFVGRDLSGADTAPKYVNTAQTPAYTKGDHLLGVHEAPADARLVRVEGAFDAIAVTAAGDGGYAGVAPLGTALTGTQADTLAARSGGRVWEALDNDDAGARATEQDYWLLRDRGVDARAIPLPTGTDPAQLWREDPTLLRTLLDVADAAPTAGVAVIDNTVRDLRPGLRAGDANAYEELAAVLDTVAAGLPTDQDRANLNGYADAAVDRLRDQADPARVGSDRPDVVDEQAAGVAAATSPDQAERLQATAARARDGTDRPAGRVGDLDAAASGAATSTPTYDRATPAALARINDSEAAKARRASSAGFSRPTRDMLTEAQARTSGQTRPATQPAPTLGRSRAQRR